LDNRLFLAALILFATVSCREELPDVPPMRETTAIEYVRAEQAIVHQKPETGAAEVARISNGEPVSVLAYQGKWAEVRTGTGSGWVERTQLSAVMQDAKLESTKDTPRFRRTPLPVTSPGNINGEIVLEAAVNTDGQVVSIKTLTNSTGSAELEARNITEFRKASFYPMVVNGKRKPFLYYQRVEY